MALIEYKGHVFDEGINSRPPLYSYEGEEIAYNYEPSFTVSKWLNSPKEEHALIGGFGSGKSVALCYKAWRLCAQNKGARGVIIRATLTDLEQSTMTTFFEVVPPEAIAHFDKQKKIVYIYTDDGEGTSEIQFIGADRQMKWRGREIMFFGIDEVSEFDAEKGYAMYTELLQRLRQAGMPRYYAMTVGNPNGHNWHYKLFHGDNKSEKEFLIASTIENAPNLPKGYIKRIIDTYPAELVSRYLNGSCEVADGLVFKEFGKIHQIKSTQYELMDSWERIAAIDPGQASAFATLWVALDNEGNLICYDEYYQPDKLLSEHATALNERLTGKEFLLIDPASRAKTREGQMGFISPKDELEQKYGISAIPAINEIKGGIDRMLEYFHPSNDRIHLVLGTYPAPRIYIYADKCPNLVRELSNYVWGKVKMDGSQKPKENQDDHLIDCLRYIVSHAYIEERTGVDERSKEKDAIHEMLEQSYARAVAGGTKMGYTPESMDDFYD